MHYLSLPYCRCGNIDILLLPVVDGNGAVGSTAGDATNRFVETAVAGGTVVATHHAPARILAPFLIQLDEYRRNDLHQAGRGARNQHGRWAVFLRLAWSIDIHQAELLRLSAADAVIGVVTQRKLVDGDVQSHAIRP